MQEVLKDGTMGETHVEKTLEGLLPHIKKSISDPNVKYVKVFRAKTLKGKKRFAAAEAPVEEKEEEIDPIEDFELFVESYQAEKIFKEKLVDMLKECPNGELFKTILSLFEPEDDDRPEDLENKKEAKKAIEKELEFMLMQRSKILKKMGTKAGEEKAK